MLGEKAQKMIRKLSILLAAFILWTFSIYVVFGAMMFVLQDRMLYHPSSSDDFISCEGFENYSKENYETTRFYFDDVNSTTLLIYYSGNGGSACDRAFLAPRFERFDYDLAFVEYTGYAGDNEKPSQEALFENAIHMAEYAEQEGYEEVRIIGESLGTSVAAYQTTIGEVKSVVLLAPFYSSPDLGQEMFPYYPVTFLHIENYDTVNYLKYYKGNVTIIHGLHDDHIPLSQAQRLYEELETENKELVIVEYAKHNDLYRYWDTWRGIRRGSR